MKTKTLQEQNVLITGGAGFIGSYLTHSFLTENANIYIIDDLSTGSIDNIPKNINVHFLEGSIMNVDFLRSLSGNVHFDLIIHLASVVGMRLATKYQQKVYDIATVGTRNVLEAFKDIPTVLFSSSAVYGMQKTSSVKETEPVTYDQLLEYDGGNKGYACGKYDMEQIGLEYSEAGRKIIIIRPFNIIGNRQLSTYGMVVPNFIDQALTKKPLSVFNQGNQIRSFTCVKKFQEALLKIVKNEEAWLPGNNIINIGAPRGNSISELAKIVIEETGALTGVTYTPYEEIFPNHKDVNYRVPNISHGETIFGEIDWPDLRAIVKDILIAKTTQKSSLISSEVALNY